MPRRILIVLFALLVVAGAAVASLRLWGRAPGAPTRTVELSMKEYTFNGDNPTLSFRPGERVRFIVTNDEESNVLHNFRIAGMNVPCGPPMKPGEVREVIATIPKSGEFAYTCCTHPGMGGKMVVASK
jgi:plastocyanin